MVREEQAQKDLPQSCLVQRIVDVVQLRCMARRGTIMLENSAFGAGDLFFQLQFPLSLSLVTFFYSYEDLCMTGSYVLF